MDQDVSYREMQPAEAEAALALRNGIFAHAPMTMESWVRAGRQAAIAIHKGEVVGAIRLDVGRLTETLRLRPGARRSNHPTHSIAAIGAGAAALTSGHELATPRPSPWGEQAFGGDSPWERLARWDAHYLLLGVDFNVCTLFHYVQAVLRADHLAKRGGAPPWPPFDFRQMGRACAAAGQVTLGRCGAATLVGFAIQAFLTNPARWTSLAPDTPFGAWWAAHGSTAPGAN